jgi:hypothetical protein
MIKPMKIFALLLLTSAEAAFAQEGDPESKKRHADSVKNIYMTEAAIRNPLFRQVSVSTDVIAPADMKSHYNGSPLLDGRIRQVRTSALINIPVTSWGKNSVSVSASAFQQHFSLDRVIPYQASVASITEKTADKLTVGLSGSFVRIDSLLGKPVVYTLSVTGLTNSTSSVKKMSYLGGMVFTLKRTAATRTSLGFLVNIDPSITLPVIPVIGYWHKFRNDLELNVNIPQQVVLRKTFSPNFWATLGTSVSGSIAFFRNSQPGVPEDINYSSIELKTGPGLEYRVSKKFIFGINGGLFSPVQVRAFDRTKNSDDYFLKNRVQSSGFVNFTVSVLPFL